MTAAAYMVGDRYILLETLGAGGMGTVYAAQDRLEGERVALKRVIAPSGYQPGESSDSNQDLRVALTHEFRTLAGLRHPNVIPVLDYGFSTAGQPFFTMPLIKNAQTLLQAAEDLDLPAKIDLLLQMLGALAYLHRRDILHCDLKPGNVLVDPEGHVRVLDFGLASSGDSRDSVAGTVHYLAPELFTTNRPGRRSDIYAAGVLAYEVLIGRYPYPDDDMQALVQSILLGEVDWAPLEALNQQMPIARIVRKMMATQPAHRYDSIEPIIADWCVAAGRPLPPETTAMREGYIQAATFVGREVELDLLTKSLAEILPTKNTPASEIRQGGSAWLVGGESGVGKSRLLEELRVRALTSGALVLRGQGVEGAARPYQVLRDVVRRLVLTVAPSPDEAAILKNIVPDIGDLLGFTLPDTIHDDDDKTKLIQTVCDLFRRLNQPALVLLEDLQWARRSLAIVQTLVEQVGGLRLMIVATYRADEWPELPRQVRHMRSMILPRLSKTSVGTYAGSLLTLHEETEQVVEFLYRESEGNAFFLVEVLRVLAKEAGTLARVGQVTLPQHVFAGGVETVIARRLSRIPVWDQFLLHVAAVAGRAIDLNILQAVDGAADVEAWLTTCANAAVLEVNDGVWRFAHDKLREHILKSLPGDRLANLHRVVALATENVYPDDSKRSLAMVLAEHWRVGGDPKKEHLYLTAFGNYMTRTGHRLEAVKYLRDAMSLFRRLGDAADEDTYRRQIRSGIDHGLCLMELGKCDEAIEVIKESRALARTLGDEVLEGIAEYYQWYAVMLRGDFAEAEAGLRQNLAWAERRQNNELIGRALDGLARSVRLQKRYSEGVECLERALAVNATLNSPYAVAYVQIHLGYAYTETGNYAKAHATFAAGLATCRALGHKAETAWALVGMAILAQREADWATCVRDLHEAIEISHQTLDRVTSLTALLVLGQVCVAKGQARIAAEWLGLARQSPQKSDIEVQSHLAELHQRLASALDASTLAAAMAHGASLKLPQVLAGALQLSQVL
ncbi:MAG: hypothetical protein BroJett018_38950 [Chloroflexota bacterium]|nr:MAG: hypothetical protein BroJett018_38950 [Chloroflexota bacterium]